MNTSRAYHEVVPGELPGRVEGQLVLGDPRQRCVVLRGEPGPGGLGPVYDLVVGL